MVKIQYNGKMVTGFVNLRSGGFDVIRGHIYDVNESEIAGLLRTREWKLVKTEPVRTGEKGLVEPGLVKGDNPVLLKKDKIETTKFKKNLEIK